MHYPNSLSINHREYPWPKIPIVVICVDGSEPDYIKKAIDSEVMPFTKKMIQSGSNLIANCVIPSFTNPNNLSIVTGVPPSIHGICGNFILDPENGEEVMMNDPKYLKAETIMNMFHNAGAKVAVITAKDKLRKLLGNGLDFSTKRAICFSSEKADEATQASNGINNVLELVKKPIPAVYSSDLSEFIFAAGVALMKQFRPDIMYLSTTDYIQHKYAPGSDGANNFYAMMDRYWSKLSDYGALLAITADHGMNAKHDKHGQPIVIYLQEILDEWLGHNNSRVILPITDPYVIHHGALGGYATVYVDDKVLTRDLCHRLEQLDGIELCLEKHEACERFDLPSDKVGNLVIIAQKDTVLGTSPSRHDLSGLNEPLRSHGGLSEQRVPILINRQNISGRDTINLRNYDIFYLALNNQ